MSQRSQWDRERALEDALEGSGLARSADDSEDAELRDLLALTSELRELGDSLPAIDERQVWLRVRSGMLDRPQRSAPRGLWERLLPMASFTPRLIVASMAGVLLFLGAAVASLLMQATGSASAAFIERLDSIEGTSALVAEHREVSPDERARIEREAFELLDLASKPGVLSDVPAPEAEAIRARLANVRGSLAAVLNEDVTEARTLAALAAVSGLIDAPPVQVRTAESPTVAPTSTAAPTASPTPVPPFNKALLPVATVTVTPSAVPTRTPAPPTVVASPAPRPSASPTPSPSPERTASPTPSLTPSATSTATPSRPTVTPPAVATVVGSPTQPPTQRPTQAEAAARSSALAKAQSLCSKVVDRASLEACMGAGAQAQEACPISDPTCLAVLEGIVQMAQERLERMRDGCRRLNSSKARAACEDAMRIDGKRSNFTYEDDSPSSEGSPIQSEIPSRGSGFNSRRDW